MSIGYTWEKLYGAVLALVQSDSTLQCALPKRFAPLPERFAVLPQRDKNGACHDFWERSTGFDERFT
jgi:hypothetical protein